MCNARLSREARRSTCAACDDDSDWPRLPVALSVPVLAWLLGYSYAKRFTMLAHVWLGIALGLAPVAAWIAL